MARKAKALTYAEATAIFVALRNLATQTKAKPISKKDMAELLSNQLMQLDAKDITKIYARMTKMELIERYETTVKGVYVKQTAKGKAFIKAYTVIFGESPSLDS